MLYIYIIHSDFFYTVYVVVRPTTGLSSAYYGIIVQGFDVDECSSISYVCSSSIYTLYSVYYDYLWCWNKTPTRLWDKMLSIKTPTYTTLGSNSLDPTELFEKHDVSVAVEIAYCEIKCNFVCVYAGVDRTEEQSSVEFNWMLFN